MYHSRVSTAPEVDARRAQCPFPGCSRYSVRKALPYSAQGRLPMTLDRRSFLAACSRAGITSALMPGVLFALAAQAQEAAGTDQTKPPKITPELIDQAAL